MAKRRTGKREVSRDDRQEKCTGCGTYTSVNALHTIMAVTGSGKRSFKKECNKCRGKNK